MSSQKYALISVTDKSGILELANFLIDKAGYKIISTGGTYKYLKDGFSNIFEKHNINLSKNLIQVSDLTNFPEILDGRVKTLHPKIHGALLANRDKPSHQKEILEHDIPNIDVVVVNLYQFSKTVENNNVEEDDALENIDIGGHTLIRASAKNFKNVWIFVNPSDYIDWIKNYYVDYEDKELELATRRSYARKAFIHCTEYDTAISNYFQRDINKKNVIRNYRPLLDLKYGCNPYQKFAGVYVENSNLLNSNIPLVIKNGTPGYINMLDALGAWNLVKELGDSLNLPAAASFKHTSPAGVGLGVDFTNENILSAYDINDIELTPLATAFIRARNADPMSSFGDFIALNSVVDVETAKLIKREVSDGIIAPGYDTEALQILNGKKNGNYIIMEIDPTWSNQKNCDGIEFREIGGFTLAQQSNTKLIDKTVVCKENIVMDESKHWCDEIQRDLILANITLKYTQSNSVVYASDGQVIGVGAGQQNRVDCVRLAGRKSDIWSTRLDPDVLQIWKDLKGKRQDKVNTIIDLIREKLIHTNYNVNKNHYAPVVMASDAFFPFSDSIEVANQHGVKFITQPGGSMADNKVLEICQKYGIGMMMTGVRLFTH